MIGVFLTVIWVCSADVIRCEPPFAYAYYTSHVKYSTEKDCLRAIPSTKQSIPFVKGDSYYAVCRFICDRKGICT